MNAEELQARLAARNIVVVDVRHPFEFRAGHIPGAVNIPFWQVGRLVEKVTGEERDVVLTCEHGPRAWMAAALLRLRTGRSVRLLQGHMLGWKKTGLPLCKES